MKNIIFIVAILLIAAIVALMLSKRQTQPSSSLTPSEAEAMIVADTGIVIIDVRTIEEYRSPTGHLCNALLIPVQNLEDQLQQLEQYKERTFIVYSQTGEGSADAALLLHNHGFKVLNIAGGMQRWSDENLPVIVEHRVW